MKILFEFHAKAFMSNARFYLVARMGESVIEVRWPERAAYLVNKYSRTIRVEGYGFGYEADLPDSAVLALKYTVFRQTSPSKEELDNIVASGTTPLHTFRQKLGAYNENMAVKDLFLKDAVGKELNLCFRDFPKLILYSNGSARLRVEFNAESVKPEFLRRALSGELTEAEKAMLKGISLLQRNAQTKFMRLLSYGLLTTDSLAKTLCKAANSAKEKDVWLPLVEWLRENGYSRDASEIFARKTMI